MSASGDTAIAVRTRHWTTCAVASLGCGGSSTSMVRRELA